MSNNANSQQSGQQAWWTREKRDALGERIGKIQRINDPTTNADEVLTGAKILIIVLLFFSGALGALSYFKNFSISFSFEFSCFLALCLTFTIEWGKNKCATWAARIPFFQGWGHISRTPANTFIFAALVLVTMATFAMSIYNSTKGGEQLALMLGQERNHSPFQADTKSIDEQIAATQLAITNAPMGKWKGRMYYQDAKGVRADKKSLESLQRQREATSAQQRADWEKEQQLKQTNTSFGAKVVLASGGWVELLQVLLIILRVACEKTLDGRQSPTPQQQRAPVAGFKPGQPGHVPVQNTLRGQQLPRPIGFNVDQDGNVQTSANNSSIHEDSLMSVAAVPQTPLSVAQQPQQNSTIGADQILLLLRSNLIKEIPNLANHQAKPATVSGRIASHLDQAGILMSQNGFTPSRDVALQVAQYLMHTAFPTLRERGWPYAREINFMSRLIDTIPGGEGA